MPHTADLSRVTALGHKGCELALKGHSARAAEKFSRALEEAEKALPVPDCLVACSLRTEQLESLLHHATASPTTPADADVALREACMRLLPSVMAVLERRKAAGRLLPGTCRPVEEAYYLSMSRRDGELFGHTPAYAAERAALLAPFVGVEMYFRVASSLAYMLNNMETLMLKRAFVLSDEQKHAAYLFLASAVDLMARPLELDAYLAGETEIVKELRILIPKVSDVDLPETTKLCAAWRRLLHSGMLHARGIDSGIDFWLQRNARLRAAAAADLAAGRLQRCALAGCAASESHVSQFKRCGACRTVCYCSREHQVEDWPSHKASCKAARKAADPSGDP